MDGSLADSRLRDIDDQRQELISPSSAESGVTFTSNVGILPSSLASPSSSAASSLRSTAAPSSLATSSSRSTRKALREDVRGRGASLDRGVPGRGARSKSVDDAVVSAGGKDLLSTNSVREMEARKWEGSRLGATAISPKLKAVDTVEDMALVKERAALKMRLAELDALLEKKAKQQLQPAGAPDAHQRPRKIMRSNSDGSEKSTRSRLSVKSDRMADRMHRLASAVVSAPGYDDEEVHEHVAKFRPAHSRRLSRAHHKVVSLVREPLVLEEPHDETFFELFYDLIVVVVLIKLAYLKHDMTFSGVLTVFTVFANFWSCWSLMNTYATMLHAEDLLHRLYYTLHIAVTFFMALTISDPDYSFFDWGRMGWYHAGASVVCRAVTVLMWAHAAAYDHESRKDENSVYNWHNSSARKQMAVHAASIVAAIVLFVISMSTWLGPWALSSQQDAADSDRGAHEEPLGEHAAALGLWLAAVAVEQLGNTFGAVFMKLPFAATYAGERMQAWLMLCFGESVIALLIEPLSFLSGGQLGSIFSAFVMMLCLCTAWFDVVDADQFLHLYVVRGAKKTAFAFMTFQCFFSFFVFLCGAALKTIIFISESVYLLHEATGCGDPDHSDDYSRRLLATGEARVSRRLGSEAWSIQDLDLLLFRSFVLLTVSIAATMTSSILIGYSMPTGVPSPRLHLSRVGAMLICLTACVVPFHLRSIATPCLLEAESVAMGTQHDSSEGRRRGLTLMQALITTSVIILASFGVALGSLDRHREETCVSSTPALEHTLDAHTHTHTPYWPTHLLKLLRGALSCCRICRYAMLEEQATFTKAKAHIDRKRKRISTIVGFYTAAVTAVRFCPRAVPSV